ncbi:MAG: hypothetical protein QNJ54_19640 [Prochloraceae cyanobacterium]|nr:hypothetical protein [Prochloraceae cyanobacterium]
MQVRWKKLLPQIVFWLAAEISLNFLGLDDMADYTEFLNLIYTYEQVNSKFKSEDLNFYVNSP